METKHPSVGSRSYEDFEPVCKWRTEEGRDTLEVHLPGFRKDHVRVQVNHLGFMVISGESPSMDGTKRRRFKKEVELPRNCNEDAVRASFMQSILTVVMPKKAVSSISHSDQERDQTRSPKFEPHKDPDKRKEREEETDNEGTNEALGEDADSAEHESEGKSSGSVELAPETTKEVTFKILVVIVIMLVIASYVTDMFKNVVAHSHFLN